MTFQLHHGDRPVRSVRVGHGALVGRLESAAIQIDAATVSEAHALVSLRSGGLQLLALRRRFQVDGRTVSEVDLRSGLRIELAPEIALSVEAVELPASVLGLRWPGGQAPLLHDAAAIVVRPVPGLRWRMDGDALARLWRVGDRWRIEVPGQQSVDLVEGQIWELGGVPFTVGSVPLASAVGAATVSPQDPLRLTLFFDAVHLQAAGRPVLAIGGNGARLICELAQAGVPMSWQAVAGELWKDTTDETVLRKRLDATLFRLRQKLLGHDFRSDLVATTGNGLLGLRLRRGDAVEDRS